MASQFKKYFRLNDAACKHIIGDKLMLGGILKECVPEFENCSVTDIENKYIEGEPEISAVGVHPDTANMNQAIINTGQIHGINTESVTETEGRITYDIRFYAMTPDNDPVRITKTSKRCIQSGFVLTRPLSRIRSRLIKLLKNHCWAVPMTSVKITT